MIVAVEGPSAAGKTTWCRTGALPFVAEYSPSGTEPRDDPIAEAEYWTAVNSVRWEQALALEATVGTAVCDSDPLKLHYSWCLAAVGAAPVARFVAEAERSRAAFTAGRMGLADVVVLLAPDERTLREQRAGDATRRRRSFELHARLREPLLSWYSAVEAVDPGRVLRNQPPDLTALTELAPRVDRSDPDLLDAVLGGLPAL